MSWNFKSDWPSDETSRNWLANQALWHDSDMMLSLGIGFAIGLCIGYIL
jgi:uncharacterized membrane protein (Fun14 family)